MKRFILLLALIAPALAFTSTGDYETFTFTGEQARQSFELTAEKTHTEYRYENRAKTCYRQVLIGYENRCHWQRVPVCYIDYYGRRICRYDHRQVCRRYPIYRREAYTCYERVAIPYEVFDYNVTANINFNFTGEISGGEFRPNEYFKFGISGDKDYLKPTFSGKFLVYSTKATSLTGEGDHRNLNITYDMRLEDIKKNFSPMLYGLSAMNVSQGELYFEMGDFNNTHPVEFRLEVIRKKIGNDPILFNRVLNSEEFSKVSLNDGKARVRVDLLRLVDGLNLEKKHKIKLSVQLRKNVEGVLNPRDVPRLRMAKEITVKE